MILMFYQNDRRMNDKTIKSHLLRAGTISLSCCAYVVKNEKKSSAEVISRAFFMGNGLTLPPLPGTVERNGAWKGAEMMEEVRQDTLWVPQREDAYKTHGEILRRFSQNKVPGILIQRRWRREAQVWGFSV